MCLIKLYLILDKNLKISLNSNIRFLVEELYLNKTIMEECIRTNRKHKISHSFCFLIYFTCLSIRANSELYSQKKSQRDSSLVHCCFLNAFSISSCSGILDCQLSISTTEGPGMAAASGSVP